MQSMGAFLLSLDVSPFFLLPLPASYKPFKTLGHRQDADINGSAVAISLLCGTGNVNIGALQVSFSIFLQVNHRRAGQFNVCLWIAFVLACLLAGSLAGWQAGLLAGLLPGWLVGWLACCFDWLAGSLMRDLHAARGLSGSRFLACFYLLACWLVDIR